MGMLDAKTKAAIRRGAWCNDTRIPQHIKDAYKLPAERAVPISKVEKKPCE